MKQFILFYFSAVDKNNVEIVKLLIENNATDLNITYNDGKTLLMRGRFEIILI